ncbi:MAG: RNA 2',3'-cyclic phosphodiesterase [Candidatus Nanopelagicales bacterium]|nr:RNA 2',3'-cyclic phosphodiesterase [Candidatus Nanopelagicales bacterium]MDZ4249519.1 RNA 2',3'-cyclic phosphodiesterase [Candidatus Nanopelagicales bacterium]
MAETRAASSLRRFLAIWPDEGAVLDLAQRTDSLRETSPRWVRWQSPQRWHVTIMFLGTREISQRRLTKAASRIAAETTATPIRLEGSGRFCDVLWVGVESGPWLGSLARLLSERLAPGTRPETFRPHLTVARARGRALPSDQQAKLSSYRGPTWQPASLTLVTSTLGPRPTYQIVESYPFA